MSKLLRKSLDDSPLADLPKEMLISGIVTFLEFILFYFFIARFIHDEAIIKYIISFITAIFTFFFVLGISYTISTSRSRILWRLIFKVQNLGEDRKAITSLCANQIKDLSEKMKEIRTGHGTELAPYLAAQYWSFLFSEGKKYAGTDLHVPSVYMESQKAYLDAHADLQKRANYHEEGFRFLIVTKRELMRDCYINHISFLEFLNWHKDNNVHLLQVDPFHAQRLRNEHGLRSVEVGLWYGKYSLEFQRDLNEDNSAIRLYFSRYGEKFYEKCFQYINSLRDHSEHISEVCRDIITNPPVNNDPLEKTLSEHWDQYVNCPKRLEKEGPFLSEILNSIMQDKPRNKVHVLDAAAGIGCETAFLLKEGYRVTSNEIDRKLVNILFENLSQEQRAKVDITTYNWIQMSLRFGNNKFDAILVLGNSLCLIHDEETRKDCLEQFYGILNPGGKLIIDQRNFEKILANTPDVLNMNYFYQEAIYSGRYMYCGTKVKGWPSKLNGNIITFSYGPDPDHVYGNLEMYVLKNDDLLEHLRTKFVNIEVYSDFKSGLDTKADFFTFVAQKPY